MAECIFKKGSSPFPKLLPLIRVLSPPDVDCRIFTRYFKMGMLPKVSFFDGKLHEHLPISKHLSSFHIFLVTKDNASSSEFEAISGQVSRLLLCFISHHLEAPSISRKTFSMKIGFILFKT